MYRSFEQRSREIAEGRDCGEAIEAAAQKEGE